jgi:hypothetical protein
VTTDLILTYLEFVEERHRIWEQRQAGAPQPWTDDPILATRKFTNVYRVLDYGSQFLLGMLNELDDPREQLARAFLYRHTGRPETWEYLDVMLGGYPLLKDLDQTLEAWKTYRGDAHVRTRLNDPKNAQRKTQTDYKRSVFTNAYLVFPQSGEPGTDKLESIIKLTKRLFTGAGDIVPDFLAATNQAQRFKVLRRNSGVADFMSMQILTDFGYTTEYREDEFVVPGPGAVKGAKILFPHQDPTKTVEWARDEICQLDILLYGKPPSLMDAQNTLCEWSKYHRFMAGGASQGGFRKDIYKPAHAGPQPAPIFPKDWT